MGRQRTMLRRWLRPAQPAVVATLIAPCLGAVPVAAAPVAALSLLAPAVARAERPQIVSVSVTDTEGKVVPNAWVRIPGTEGRRTVDAKTGIWEASMLYRFDGEPFVFTKGETLIITVSAPGYLAQTFEFEVRARRNELPVVLEAMPEQEILPEDLELESEDEVLLDWFRSD